MLGLPTPERLNIVSISVDMMQHTHYPHNPGRHDTIQGPITNIKQLTTAYPQQFNHIGKFKEPARLYLKDDAVPYCDAPRKTSIHFRPKIKAELSRMEHDGIIWKVIEHTDWCSSLVYVAKQDGSLRICLGPP